jgi:hypothetical protein
VVLLQTLFVTLSERSAELGSRVINAMSQSSGGELESSEEPHQPFGSLSVLDVLMICLLSSEDRFEGFAGLRVAGKVGTDFLFGREYGQ